MNALIAAAMGRSRMIVSALLLLIVAGLVTYVQIPKESDPDVNIPIIYVSMTLDGIAPEDAERLLLRPMEDELRSVEGVKETRSTAYEGGGNVILEFDAGFDVDKALTDVREKVDRVKPDLPDETDEPTVNEVNVSLFPVINVHLAGDVPQRALIRAARDLRDKVRSLPQVLDVAIAGDREELVEVIVDPLLVESYGLNANDVTAMIQRSNRLVAAGTLDTGSGRFSVKVPGLFENLQDILNMPLKVSGDAVVLFRDVAEVRRTFKDAEGYSRVGGQPAVTLEVTKRTGQNIIETIAAVRAVVDAERALWPDAIEVSYSQDRSDDIRTMLSDLTNNVISAVLLIMIVIVGALGLRSGLIVGLAIPGSFLTGMLVLGIAGLTINIVVLFALILAVGMLVDGAIVVVEYAERRMSEGATKVAAYREAAQRMAWPIISSTATTLCAFLPLLFWPGVVGEFMKYLPITLIATLAASLVMALIFVPTLGSVLGKPPRVSEARRRNLELGETGDIEKVGGPAGAYVRFLGAALRHPAKVLAAAVLALVGVWYAYAQHGTGVEFFPDVEPDAAIVLVHARGNLSVDEKDALMRQVEERVLAHADSFSTVYTRTGKAAQGQDLAEDVIGQIQLEFVDWQQRPKADDIMAEIRTATADLPGIVVETREPEAGPPVGKPIQIELASRDPTLLPAAAATVRAKLESMAGLIDIEDSTPLPGIEWRLDVDRAQAAKYGIDVTAIGDTIKLVTTGLVVGNYRPDDSDDEIDIAVRYPPERRSIEALDGMRVVTGEAAIPLANVVTRTALQKTGDLNRVDGERVMSVKADVVPGVLPDEKVQELRAWLPGAGLDPGITVTFKGEDEEQAQAAAFLGQAFGVALFLMAIILLTQFNSFYSAFLILTAVIMSTIGVVIGLLVTGQAFGIVMTGVGVISLAGIVVNNNIVLIDTFDVLKRETATAREALLRTGAQRLRPVLLTTITTILGLVPMALSTNIDFVARTVSVGAPSTQWWVQLSTAVVFGLGFATVLTLVVTPCALMVRANVAGWRARRRAGRAILKGARGNGSAVKAIGANDARPVTATAAE